MRCILQRSIHPTEHGTFIHAYTICLFCRACGSRYRHYSLFHQFIHLSMLAAYPCHTGNFVNCVFYPRSSKAVKFHISCLCLQYILNILLYTGSWKAGDCDPEARFVCVYSFIIKNTSFSFFCCCCYYFLLNENEVWWLFVLMVSCKVRNASSSKHRLQSRMIYF